MYSNYKGYTPKDEGSGDDVMSWVAVFVMMVVFWPIGLVLLYNRIKASTKKKRSALEKKSGKGISVVLLLISIVLFILGANTVVRAVTEMSRNGVNRWSDFALGVFYFIGGFISFFTRDVAVKRYARYKRYYALASQRDIVPIAEIARAVGASQRVVVRDIQAMLNEGYFENSVYIDKELGCLVMSDEAAQEARHASEASAKTSSKASAKASSKASSKAAADESAPAAQDGSGNQYMATILELRRLGESIVDFSISDKAYRIEELTGKIFRTVEENPEKLPLIRRFSSYYLPTTLKLLRSYAMLEKQGVDGENITGTKESINRVLDTLVKGFEQQLDQLFMEDALDIATDIDVLENLLQQDGLA